MLAEGPQCSEKGRSLQGLMGAETACGLLEGLEDGEKHEQGKYWREEYAGSGGDWEQTPGQRRRFYSTLSPLDKRMNFIPPSPPHTLLEMLIYASKTGQPPVIFRGSPLTQIWWRFLFVIYIRTPTMLFIFHV